MGFVFQEIIESNGVYIILKRIRLEIGNDGDYNIFLILIIEILFNRIIRKQYRDKKDYVFYKEIINV